MTRTDRDILKSNTKQLRQALERGVVFRQNGKTHNVGPRSSARLTVLKAWRPVIDRLAIHLNAVAPVVRNRATVSSVWKFLEVAEHLLNTTKVQRSCDVVADW